MNTSSCKSRVLLMVLPALLFACSAMPPSEQQPNARENQSSPSRASEHPLTNEAAAPNASKPLETSSPSSKKEILRNWILQQARLSRVAAPLLMQNTASCPQHSRNILGFTAKTKYSYSKEFIAEAQSELNLNDRLRVMTVFPESGAALAGLSKGDILLAVGSDPLPRGQNAERDGVARIAAHMKGREHVTLTVLRDGKRMRLDIPLTHACAMTIDVGNSDCIGIYADGRHIMVTRGLLDAVRSDDELAAALAGAMAQNILSPSRHLDTEAVINRLLILHKKADNTTDLIAASIPIQDARVEKLTRSLLATAGYKGEAAEELSSRFTASCNQSAITQ